MDINERALLYRAQSGDRQAAGRLFENYFREIFTYIFYKVRDSTTAQEISAEVFVRLLQDLPDYRNQQKPFINWLYSLAREQVGDHESISSRAGGEQDDPERLDLPLEVPEAVGCFRRAIQHLEEPQQSIIIHRFVEGRSLKDAAELLGKEYRAARSLQHRALVALEKALYKEDCL
jgi:RNA polymerase sigma-70 factor (ECF subfamily)